MVDQKAFAARMRALVLRKKAACKGILDVSVKDGLASQAFTRRDYTTLFDGQKTVQEILAERTRACPLVVPDKKDELENQEDDLSLYARSEPWLKLDWCPAVLLRTAVHSHNERSWVPCSCRLCVGRRIWARHEELCIHVARFVVILIARKEQFEGITQPRMSYVRALNRV
jgi:hypothetical protein